MSDETKLDTTIKEALTGLMGEISKPDNKGGPDEKAIGGYLTILVGGVLIDLRTIANAVEKLSNFELTKVGDIVLGGSPHHDTELTAEELETIEALRRGDIVVVNKTHDTPLTPAHDADERERRAMELYRDSGQAVYVREEPGGPSRAQTWAELSEVERIKWRQQVRA